MNQAKESLALVVRENMAVYEVMMEICRCTETDKTKIKDNGEEDREMEVLEIVLPVLAMIILGILCRKWKLLDQSGVNNMKTLVTNIMLPVAIFHALATAEYSGKIGILVLIMFVMLLISFGVRILDEKIYGRAI